MMVSLAKMTRGVVYLGGTSCIAVRAGIEFYFWGFERTERKIKKDKLKKAKLDRERSEYLKIIRESKRKA